MDCNWKKSVVRACLGFIGGLAICPPAAAQLDWVTTLNAPAAEIALGGPNFAQATDNSIVSAGMVTTGEATRVRVARMTSTGTTQWVRWATGGVIGTPTPLWAHPDNSVTVAYQEPASSYWCFENFSAAGDSRFRHCPNYLYSYYTDIRVTLAADGDFYFANSSYQRTIRKVSALGVLRWTRTETTNSPSTPTVQGVDSSGNYFEATGTRLVAWSSVDGTKISDVTLSGAGFIVNASNALPRANRDVVLIRSQSAMSNAITATVTRSSATGALVWTQNLVFPGYGPSDKVRLAAADNDGTYVIRTAAIDGDSHVAKISATGVVLWQRHYARVRRIVDYANILTAIRSDVTVATNSNDSFLFAISGADGTLGTPTIYTRPDLYAPTDWFATTNGLLATYQGSNPFAPFGSFSTAMSATTYFVGFGSTSNRWQVTAEARPTTSVFQGDCLMPKLSRSSPTSWWARTQAGVQFPSVATWFNRDGATGSASGQTTPAVVACGSPVTADGGQIIVSANTFDRVRKVDAAGAQIWQTTSPVSANMFSNQPLVTVAATGDATYATGSLVGRVNASGTIAFEVETHRAN